MTSLQEQLYALRQVYKPAAAPIYDPDTYTEQHNCYAYALRLETHGWATPGQLLHVESTDMPLEQVQEEVIRQRLITDGLLQVREHGARRDAHIIAAYILPSIDFHFYSFDRDGTWSSKMAKKPVSKNKIDMPENTLMTFYEVPKTGITYYPRLEVINTLKEFGL